MGLPQVGYQRELQRQLGKTLPMRPLSADLSTAPSQSILEVFGDSAFIDTAEVYGFGKSEEFLGEFMKVRGHSAVHMEVHAIKGALFVFRTESEQRSRLTPFYYDL